MTVISIRLPNTLLHDLDGSAHVLHVPRAEYIRKAIEHMNEEVHNKERKKKLVQSSLRVRKGSMRVNKEFSEIEHDPET
jgi:metal-responsive CopG/Arc/MetJ family transcriptional regulator